MSNLSLIYAAVPKLPCKGKCQQSCGPIDASPRERDRFEARTGKPFPDALTVLRSPGMRCPLLAEATGGCTVYLDRPLICRLWGAVDTPAMRCPWGCTPVSYLSDSQGKELLRDAE